MPSAPEPQHYFTPGQLKIAILAVFAGLWLWCAVHYFIFTVPLSSINWVWPWCSIVISLLLFVAGGRRVIIPLLLLFGAGFLLELLGIHYGLFGQYRYTPALGFSASGVPLMIGLSWATLALYVAQMLSPLRMSRLVTAFAGAAWMTCIDMIIDPLAAGPLRLWTWSEGGAYYGVPFSNFISWFACSFLLLLLLGRVNWTSRIVKLIGITLIITLTLGAIRHGMWHLLTISALLITVHIITEYWHPLPKRLLPTPALPRR